jgi:hypothetical protein
LGDNSSRITSIESGAHTFTGIKTFEGDVILESNLRINGDLLVANTVHMIVSDPIMELGANNINTGDLGIIMTRHGETGNVAIVYDESQDVLNVGYTLSNAYGNTITMDTANSLTLQVNGALNVGSNIVIDDTASNVIEVSGNVKTDSLFLGNFEVVASHGLSHVTAVSAATNDTVYLNNPTTGLVVVSNVSVGENLDVTSNLTVSGNTVVSQELSVSGNTALSSNLTVSGNTALSSNLFVTGNVGIGTTEPTESLDIVGNLNLQKVSNTASIKLNSNIVMELPKHDRPLTRYPEIALTANTDRGYAVNRSSIFSGDWEGYKAFNRQRGTNLEWISNPAYTSGVYGGSQKITDVNGTDYDGEWITLQLPKAIRLEKFSLVDRDGADFTRRLPMDGTLLGSNDGTRWEVIHAWTGRTFITDIDNWFHVNSTKYYKHFGLVAEALKNDSGSTSWDMGEIKYYGTEEGDASVDVVHRSIPNKPGTQQNIVLWDPNDPASFSLADSSNVYDLSGTGNTGIFGPANNAAKPTLYSSPEGWNAWSFSGNNDCTIETEYGSAVGVTGIHSLSLWFWRDPVNNIGAQRTLASIDSDLTGAQDQTPHFTVDASGKIGYKFWSNDLTGQIETPKGQWVHVAFTYDGGTLKESRKIYINTVLDDLGTGTVNALNLPANSRFILGGYQDRTQCWDGYIAGVRLYSKVLSREQVLELFDEGAERFGIREDLVSVHKGNLGIGLRDPEQRLVVAGSLQEFPPGAMTSEYTHFTGHGIFKAISSGGEIASTEPLDAFNKDWSSSSYWYSRDNTYGTSATNVTGGRNAYTGSNSLGGYSGEWLGLMFPCGFVCKSVEIAARNGEIISAPHDIVVLGATNPFDETEWETIGTFYGKSSNDFWVDGGVGMPFPINYDKPVYGIALVFTAGNYHYAVTVSEIQFFGVPQMNVTDGRQLNVGQVMTSSVGIGKVPEAQLDVRGSGILTKGYIGGPYNGGTGRTSDLVIKQSGDVNDSAKTSGVRMFRAANDTNSWHFGVNSGTNFEFFYNNASMAYLGRTNVSVLDFTGQHRSFVDGVPHANYDNLEGLIVSANKNKYYDINEDITRGANAIQISQSLPLVSLSTKEKDKACFGVISGSEDPESREYAQGSFVSVTQKQKGDQRTFINSLGEGAMWVVNTAGPLESGDYITTSNIAGYGQRQESEFLANYTVAKITMDCDFNPPDIPVQQILRSNVVETYYTAIVDEIEQEVDLEHPDAVERTRVTDKLINVLDEHGQLQWEDDPSGVTEKAYKIRYLDTSGQQTDEANAVHIAAFVGCTYHCG